MDTLKLLDVLTGKTSREYLKLYRQTQWYSQEQMKDFQLAKLKKLIQHCHDHVPYYRKIFTQLDLQTENIRSLDELQRIPLLTKEIIQENYSDFIPDNNLTIKGIKTSQTGGTTGNILFKRNDANSRSSAWATYLRYLEWSDNKYPDRTLLLMGGHIKKQTFLQKIKDITGQYLTRTTSVDIYNTSEKTFLTIVNHLRSCKYSHLRAYPMFLYFFARRLEELNESFSLKSISTTAEPVLPIHRKLFRKVFNSEVFDQYGCGEIGGIAYECANHEGLHVAEEHVIVESNENNELIVTDLDNFTMPFLRYSNGDQGILATKPCGCGRKSQLLTEIMGRSCDYILGRNNQILHWAFFWHLFFDSDIAHSNQLMKFQIVQQANDVITIRLVCNPLNEYHSNFLRKHITDKLGDMTINFVYENDIENSPSGKYRPVINNLLS
jgi:phenylacetate-CoA ligase